ncbi:MAG: hypothetical protein ACK56F_05250, partial [bacterium]
MVLGKFDQVLRYPNSVADQGHSTEVCDFITVLGPYIYAHITGCMLMGHHEGTTITPYGPGPGDRAGSQCG